MQASQTTLESMGRDYLCQQVNHPKNPWNKAFESVSKASECARKNFRSQLKNSNLRKCIIVEPRICDEIRLSSLFQVIQHEPSLTLEELHPIFTFLKSKAKYPKTDKKYQADDDRRVLTIRLAKLLRKLAAGKMLTREEKMQKHFSTSSLA
ncbi:MAG: hypothetical protein LLG04_18430 [Parachlamydia sp.]|nr:hypothetical protein [Parachlamydia sp.]